MSNNSFKAKNGLTLIPKDLTTILNPEAGDLACDINDGNKIKRYNSLSSAWEEVGSGAGGINYVENSDAEAGIVGWSLYADTAQVSPEDGTGGTANVTLEDSTSSPLRGSKSFLLTKDAVNRQGQGVSVDFTIDSADQAQVLRISFDYSTSTNYADGDVRIYVYDVTNSRLIEVVDRDLLATEQGKFVGTFQTSPDSVSYRLIYHVASENDASYTVKFDNVVVGPQTLIKGPIVTDWKDFNTTGIFSGFTPGVAIATGKYRRVGDSVEGWIEAQFNATQTAGTSLSITLPWGVDATRYVDTGLTKRIRFGSAKIAISGSRFTGALIKDNVADGNNRFVIVHHRADGTEVSDTTFAYNSIATLNSGDGFRVHFKYPVKGWSSNLVLSEDAGNRDIYCNISLTSNQTISSTNTTDILFDQAEGPASSNFNSSNGRFTIPESGLYEVNAKAYAFNLNTNERLTLNTAYIPFGEVSGIILDVNTSTVSTDHTLFVNSTKYFEKGTQIYVNIDSTTDSSYTVSGSTGRTTLSIKKISSPQTVASGESVLLVAYADNGFPVPNAQYTTIPFNAVETDTHGTYNPSTGQWICPQSGVYTIYGTVLFQTSTAWEVGEVTAGQILVNGLVKAQDIYEMNSTVSSLTYVNKPKVYYTGYLNKGDVVQFQGYHNSDVTLNLYSTERYSLFNIVKIS